MNPEFQKKRFGILLRRLYAHNAVGGNCHIVTDDGNIEDEFINWCLEQINTAPYWHPKNKKMLQVEREILQILLTIPENQREQYIEDAR